MVKINLTPTSERCRENGSADWWTGRGLRRGRKSHAHPIHPKSASVGCGSRTMWVVVDAGLLEALHYFKLHKNCLSVQWTTFSSPHTLSSICSTLFLFLYTHLTTLAHLPHLPVPLSLTSLKLFVFLSLLTATLLAPLKQILTGQDGVTMDTKNLEKPASLLPVPPSRSPSGVAENRCDLRSTHLAHSRRGRQQRIMTYFPNNTFHAGL